MLALANPSRLSRAICPPTILPTEPFDDKAIGRQPLPDADHLFRQWPRTIDAKGEEIGAGLITDHEQILETGGREVNRPRPAPLEQRVGSAGGRQAHRHRRQLSTEGVPVMSRVARMGASSPEINSTG